MQNQKATRKDNRMDKKLPKGISQRKDGVYIGRFTFRGQRKTFYSKDIKKLQKEMNDARYEMEHGIYQRPNSMTYDQWFQIWINDYKKNDVKQGTIDLYKVCYNTYIKEALGRLKLMEINGLDIDKVFYNMADRNLDRGTMNIVKVVLQSSLKLAVKKDLLRMNPMDKADVPKKERNKEMRVLLPEEQELFLKYASENPYYYVYVIALQTGMRSGELRALKWENVDFRKREIRVIATLKYNRSEKRYFIDTPKTKTSYRKIPMTGEVANLFHMIRKQQLERKIKLANLWNEKEGFENLVFTNGIGEPISHDALNVNVKKIVASININIEETAKREGKQPEIFQTLTPHTLRHTFATNMIAAGMEPKTLSTILGHSNLAQTMDLYVHITDDMKRNELEKAMENLKRKMV